MRPDRTWTTALALLGAAWAMRLLFVYATPHHLWPYGCGFKGDAVYYIQAAARGSLLDNGLPLRPPGTAFLIGLLWDGATPSFGFLRQVWVLLGALLAPVLYLAARPLGERVAVLAGAIVAFATGPMLLSASLCNETPYLLLAVASAGGLPRLRGWGGFAGWGALQGAACLLRAEHVLFAVVGLCWVLWRRPVADAARSAGAAVLAFVLVLLPWHLTAWAAVETLNERPREAMPYSGRWSDEARARIDALPAFARASSVRMIQATVRARGRSAVEAADLGILEEAYGEAPQRLASWPFISVYGPLNFYLANHRDAGGGFSRAPLFAAPQLRGGADRYPPGLLQALPRELELSYPPHAGALVHGYAMGWAEITADPLGWLGLAGRKLARTWAGAARGFGGYAAPVGLSGVRHKVDLVVATGAWSAVFELVVLCVAGLGVRLVWRRREAWPWLLLLASRVATVVLFFGYARQGALLVPVVALLLAAVLDRCWSRALHRTLVALGGALMLAELVRWSTPPAAYLDDVELRQTDPTVGATETRRLEFR